MKIKNIYAREILNSGGTASLEVEATLEDGTRERASVPFGVSAGSHEAFVLFDGGTRYGGRGMLKAVENVNTEIKASLVGKDASNQREVDNTMIELDGTPNKQRLGANAILCVSLAVARAEAKSEGLELYEYIHKIFNFQFSIFNLPSPMIVVIEGGKHADNSTDFQEYLIVPRIYEDFKSLGSSFKLEPADLKSFQRISARESIRCGAEVYLTLKKVLKENGYNTNVGNEGAYAGEGIRLNEEPWDLIMEAIEKAGYKPGIDVMLAADLAASEFAKDVGVDFDEEDNLEIPYTQDIHSQDDHIIQYQLKREDKVMSSYDLINYVAGLVEKYPFISIEDILAEDDWINWARATEKLKDKVRLIGDDLLVTNPTRLRIAIEEKSCNGILIKLNQIGTLTETINTIKQAKDAGFWTIVSHRGGGETNDTFMVDLAVASQSEMVKVGISRGERVCKYNRLMEIEEKIINYSNY